MRATQSELIWHLARVFPSLIGSIDRCESGTLIMMKSQPLHTALSDAMYDLMRARWVKGDGKWYQMTATAWLTLLKLTRS